MLTKVEFKEIITNVIELMDLENELDVAMKKLSPDFMGFSLEKATTIIFKTLKYTMKDTSDWIGYWLFEIEQGKKAVENSVVGINGKNIPIKTIDDLYNIISKTYVKKKGK